MEQVWATVIGAIGSATIAGTIGILSASVSYRMSSRQLNAQLAENERNRKHQVGLAIGAKKREALESLWRLLFVLETKGQLNDSEFDLYIRVLMWLSPELRKDCLSLVREGHHLSTGSQQSLPRDIVARIREVILQEANEVA